MVIGFQWIIFIGIALVSWLVQMNLQNKFKKYSKIPTGNGMTGRDVAIKMLQDNGSINFRITGKGRPFVISFSIKNSLLRNIEIVNKKCY